MLGTRARIRACRHRSVRAVSSPGAPHRGGGLPASKPGLSAGARDDGELNRAILCDGVADRDNSSRATGARIKRTRAAKDPPRTRQSLLILAAFRPWGGSQDGRRAGGRRPSLREAGGDRAWPGSPAFGCPVSSPTEDSPSGLGRTIGNRVGRDPSGVQIPYPPPANPGLASGAACADTRRFGRGSQFGAQLPSKLGRRNVESGLRSVACKPGSPRTSWQSRTHGVRTSVPTACSRVCALRCSGEGRPRRDRVDISGLRNLNRRGLVYVGTGSVAAQRLDD